MVIINRHLHYQLHKNLIMKTEILSEQHPVNSGFDASTTAEDVIKGVDLKGKVAIVTGGYSGLGLETVRVLRNAGAKIIVPTRDINRAGQALKGIDVEIEFMDLLDPHSINAFAEKFLSSNQPLHLLINSAGIMANPFTKDARGYESQFATNHLGHFQLAAKLWPALVKANGARVVSVSSWGHHFSPVVFDDIMFEHREYERFQAYGQSKTANILFALEVYKRGKEKNVRAFSVHPGGIIGTGLDKHISREDLKQAGVLDENGEPICDPAKNLKTIEQGAATILWCAVSTQLNNIGGVYCENADVAVIDDEEQRAWILGDSRELNKGVRPYAIDEDNAARLWDVSEQLTNAKFTL
jgi:NAD(P)-dependent dehydrogenase (short-subunit alcohol dehydrogenase family)